MKKKSKSKLPTITVSPEMMIGTAVGGAGTIVVNRLLESVDAIVNNPQADAIIGGLEVAAGIALMTQFGNDIVQGAGAGMVGAGALKLTESVNLTTGNTGNPDGVLGTPAINDLPRRGRLTRRRVRYA